MTNAPDFAPGPDLDLWLTHDGVGLGPLRADLAETYWRWESTLRVMAGYGRLTPDTLTERTAGLDSQMRHSDSQTRFTMSEQTQSGSSRWCGEETVGVDGQEAFSGRIRSSGRVLTEAPSDQ